MGPEKIGFDPTQVSKDTREQTEASNRERELLAERSALQDKVGQKIAEILGIASLSDLDMDSVNNLQFKGRERVEDLVRKDEDLPNSLRKIEDWTLPLFENVGTVGRFKRFMASSPEVQRMIEIDEELDRNRKE